MSDLRLLFRSTGLSGVSTRGATYVEFLIAFVPVFVFFVSLWQVGEILITRLVLSNAAFAAARAAAVYIPLPDDRGDVSNSASERSLSFVQGAALIAAAPVMTQGWIAGTPTVSLPAVPGDTNAREHGPYRPEGADMVHVQIVASFRCHMPPSDLLLCTATGNGFVRAITVEASFPYQGARYLYDAQAQ